MISIIKNPSSEEGNGLIIILPPLLVCLMALETKLYIILPRAFLSNQTNNSGSYVSIEILISFDFAKDLKIVLIFFKNVIISFF